MNLRFLLYLRLVIHHGSFSAAARAGGVSQPAISHAMRQLQLQFDTPLFVKSGRRQVPTEVALRVALQGADIADRVGAMGESVATASRRGTLRVGVTPSAALVCGPALHLAWCHDHPHRRLAMSSADEGRMLAGLRGGELDLVIAPMPRGYSTAGLVTQALYHIRPQAYARRTHPLVKAQSLAQLASAEWAMVEPSVRGPVDVLREAFAVRRMPPARITASCPDYASMINLIAHTDLLGVLPHAALLDNGPKGLVVPLSLREALPRYEMHVFTLTRLHPRLASSIAELQRQLATTMSDTAFLSSASRGLR